MATGISQEFPGLPIRGPIERGFTSSLLNEKFTWRVPISGLVPLSLACASGPHDMIAKEPQLLDKSVKFEQQELLGLTNSGQRATAVFNFPD